MRMRVIAHHHRDARRARRRNGLEGILAQPLRLLDELRREAARLHFGDELEDAERRHEHDPALRHAVEHRRSAVERLAVLDRVDARIHRQLDAGEAFGVRRDAEALPVRFLDDRLDLGPRHLSGLHRLAGHGEGAGRHDLDQVGALLDLLAHGLAHLVGSVRLAVHRREQAPAGRGGGYDLAAQQQPRAGAQLRADRLALREQLAAVAAEVARSRDAAREHGPGCGRLRVGPYIRLVRKLAAGRGRERQAAEVDVGVDQARHDRAPTGVDDAVAIRGHVAVDHLGDDSVADQHGRALARRPSGSVDEAPAHEGEVAHSERRCAIEIRCQRHGAQTFAGGSGGCASLPRLLDG